MRRVALRREPGPPDAVVAPPVRQSAAGVSLIPSAFEQLGLIEPLARAVADLGYEKPSPIQEQAIPIVLSGRDLMAGAQTGTGKTAAFALPILQRMAPLASTSTSPARHPIRALVLAPTRELAIQVESSFRDYAKHLPLRTACVYGGVDMNAQIAQLRLGVEVLVATPGRLLDHVQNKTVNFSQVAFLTLDEADRMMDMGFMPDLRRIIALLPTTRQNLLFSATFPDEIRKLAATMLKNPAEVQVAARNAVADLVTHIVHPVARQKKRELLCHIIRSRDLKQVLVFTGTRIGANRLAHELRRVHIHADAIHGDKSQAERIVALDEFKAGKIAVLVATDVASRGLDIEGLPQVINFDIPHSPEDYVHRIGRTGRAGMAGEAISLVSSEDGDSLAAIEKLIGKRIERVLVQGFEPEAGAVAGMDASPARRDAGQVRRREGRRAGTLDGGGKPRAPAQPQDPIFSRPYEPSANPSGTPAPATTQSSPRRRARPVAALLGGLKRANG